MKLLALLFVAGVLLLAGCITDKPVPEELAGLAMTVYKSSSCGCCSGWTGYAQGKGFAASTVNTEDMASVKARLGVPRGVESCHTAVVGDYFVEGHVPAEAIAKLLEEQPDIRGIALPDMPSGSPGMPGGKTEAWVIYAVHNDGSITEFMTI